MNEVVHRRSGNEFASKSRKKSKRSRTEASANTGASFSTSTKVQIGEKKRKKKMRLSGKNTDDGKPILSGNQYQRKYSKRRCEQM